MTRYTKIVDTIGNPMCLCAYIDQHQFCFYHNTACTIGPFYYPAENRLSTEIDIGLAEYTDLLIEILQSAKAAKL
jgi:predicted amidohydrolase